MAVIDSLPPDQRAVLQLVLQRGRSYDDIAATLSINRAAVRQRALDALDALAPQSDISEIERSLVTDYLLGQLPSRVAAQVRARLAVSAAQNEWARAVASELATLDRGSGAEVPALSATPMQATGGRAAMVDESSAPSVHEAGAPAGQVSGHGGGMSAGGADEQTYGATEPFFEGGEFVHDAPEPFDEAAESVHEAPEPSYEAPEPSYETREPGPEQRQLEPLGAEQEGRAPGRGGPAPSATEPPFGTRPPGRGRARPSPPPPERRPASSRRGGAVLLGLLAVLVIAGVIIAIVASGGSSPKHSSKTASTTGTQTTTTTATTQAQKLATIELSSPSGSRKTVGVAEVVRLGHKLGIVIAASGLPANSQSNAYAVWLYNSPTSSHRVGFVNTLVSRSGQLETDGPLPANAASYHEIYLTLETQPNPKQPGKVVLSGRFTTS